jgi:hypothetical protein
MKRITNSRIRSALSAFLVLFTGFVSYAQCTNGAAYLTANAATTNASGQPQQIGTCTFYTEYNTINTLQIGSPYIFTATNAGSNVYVTITDAANVVIAHGQSPLLVSSVSAASVRLHPSVDAVCTTSPNVCLVTTVQFLPACPSPNQLGVNTLTQTSAMATWNPLGTEAAWDFQWGPTGFAIGSGTFANNLDVAEYALSGLTQNTTYQFYVRAKCATEDSNWNGPFTFTTLCDPIGDFVENFDSATTTGVNSFPACWTRGGNAVNGTYITTGGVAPGSAPNRLYMFASGTAVPATESYAIMPELNNLQAGTNRLKFKAYATVVDRIMEVGYMTDASDISTFVFISEIVLPGTTAATAQEFTVVPGVLPATAKHLAFKNPGFPAASTTLYIDDVKWEFNSPCEEPTALGTSSVSNNGFVATWTAGGTSSDFEVQYGLTNFVLGTGTIVPVTTNSASITGLNPDTNYQYYVRAICTDNIPSSWSGPFSVRTLCNDVAEFIENFDSYPSGVNSLPICWSRLGSGSTYITTGGIAPGSAPNRMYLFASGTANPPTEAVLVTVPLSNLSDGTHRFKFKGYATTANRPVEVGYLTNPSDLNTFTILQTIELPGTAAASAQEFTIIPGVLPAGAKSIAIKNPGFPTGSTTMYLDDFKWEVNSSCLEPTALTSNGVSTTTFTAAWTPGGPETAWEVQYGATNFALGSGTTLPASAANLQITGLMANTSYQYYVRAVCTGDIPSSWSGPFNFTTLCEDTQLVSENFDSFTISVFSNLAPMAPCWNRGGNGTVYMTTGSTAPMSPSNRLYMFSSSTTTPPTVGYAMLPPLSNLAAGTHRLKFKYYATLANRTIDVGYFTNPADVNSFVVLQTITTPGTTAASAQEYIVVPTGVPAGTKVIGFRNNGFPASSNTSYIDDVIWEQIPACVIPTDITSVDIQKFQATIQLTAGNATQTSWNIEYGLNGFAQGTGTVLNTSTTSTVVSGLLPSTAYQYYVTGVCGTDGSSLTAGPFAFTTLCEYPDLDTTTGGTVCGLGTVNLNATSLVPTAGFEWYTAATGGVPVGNGTSFTTPDISTTTSYYVSATSINPGTNVQVGNGLLNSTFAGGSVFQHGWGGYKTQNLITAEELLAAGISAGPINSVAWDLISTGAVNRNDFSLSIGATTVQALTNTHQTGLNQVFSTTVLNLTVGINTITFTTPFTWDGTSNIIIETCWSNQNTGGTGADVRHDATSYVSSTYTYADNRTAAEICATLTGGVANAAGVNSGGTLTSSLRPKFIFNATGVCRSPRQEVIATVTPPDAIEASATLTTVCAESPTTLSVTSTNTNYTYVWTPGNLEGASVTVNPSATTTYTVTANDVSTGCATSDTVTINVNPIPTEIILANADNLEACEGGAPLMLSVSGAQIDGVVLLSEDFNGPTNNWTTLNNSTAPTPAQIANVAWTLRPNGYVQGVTYNSNDGTQFYLSDSDSGGSGSVTDVSLVSPVFSTVGYSQLNLSFWHFYQTLGTAKVQYSVNNGDWVDLQTYTTTQGAANAFVNAILPMPAATLGQSNVRVRFQYNANWGWRWAIDNVTLSGTAISTIEWSPIADLFIDEDGTIPYTAGTNASTVYTSSDVSTTYTATATTALGCTRSIDAVVTVNPTPAAPVAMDQTFCVGATVSDLMASAAGMVSVVNETPMNTGALPADWNATNVSFQTATGGYARFDELTSELISPIFDLTGMSNVMLTFDVAKFGTGDNGPLSVSVSNDGGVTWTAQSFVSSTPTSATYISDSQAITVSGDNVRFKFTRTESPSQKRLRNFKVTASSPVTGAVLQWFADEVSTTPLENTEILMSGNYTVRQLENDCLGDPTTVAVTINVTEAPVAMAQSFCDAATVADLMATGTDLIWYASVDSVDALAATDAVVTGTYYVSQTLNGCESVRTAVEVTINVTEAPVAMAQSFCDAATVADLMATGTDLIWYASVDSVDALASTDAVVTGTYYVSQTLNGCESVRTAVEVTINVTEAPVAMAQSFCDAATVADLMATGTDLIWYASVDSVDALASTDAVVTGTYYVSQTLNGCESVRTAVEVTINTVAIPTGDALQVPLEGSTVAALVAVGENIVWYANEADALAGTSPLNSTDLLVNGTYYATQTVNGCTSAPFEVLVELTLSADGFDMTALKYYPNPVVSNFNISYSDTINQVTVMNVLGQSVMKQANATNTVSLDMSHLPAGTYMVQIESNEMSTLVKVVKR